MLKRKPFAPLRTAKITLEDAPDVWFRVATYPLSQSHQQVLERCLRDGNAMNAQVQLTQAQPVVGWEQVDDACERWERLLDDFLEHFLLDWNIARQEEDGRVWFADDSFLARLPEHPPCTKTNRRALVMSAKTDLFLATLKSIGVELSL